MQEGMEEVQWESPEPGSISEQPLASAMENADEGFVAYSSDAVEREESPIDWQSLSILNGRNHFIIVHDIADCAKCWSLSTHYNILSHVGGDDGEDDDELLMSGKRLFSLPGCKPSNIYVSDLNNSNVFYVSFVTCGCFPVLKRVEVRDIENRRIGTVACNSKLFTSVGVVIKNELEGVSFGVKNGLLGQWDHEIRRLDESQAVVATVVRHGPAHTLQIDEGSLMSSSNKALFIALCLFLDTRRRHWTTYPC